MLAPLGEAVLEPVALPPVRLEAFRLTEAEARVLRKVDGTFTVAKIDRERRGRPRRRIARRVHRALVRARERQRLGNVRRRQ